MHLLKQRHQRVHQLITTGIHLLTLTSHLLLPYIQKHGVGLLILAQESVSLRERLIIGIERVYIRAVILCYHLIHQPAAVFRHALYQHGVRRRHKDYGYQANMLRESLIFLLVALHMFLLSTFHSTVDMLFHVTVGIMPLEDEEVGTVVHHLRIDRIVGASTERQVVHGIQEICLSLAVVPHQTVEFCRERQLSRPYVFVVNYRDIFQYHAAKLTQTEDNTKCFQEIIGNPRKYRNAWYLRFFLKKGQNNFTIWENMRNFATL